MNAFTPASAQIAAQVAEIQRKLKAWEPVASVRPEKPFGDS